MIFKKIKQLFKNKLDFFIYKNLIKKHDENIKKYPNLAVFAFDRISIDINIFGLYEKNFLECLEKNLLNKIDKKSICLDIGANIGNHTLFFSEFFEKVIAFEPLYDSHELLNFNCRNKKNIITYNIGLSNISESRYLYSYQSSALGSATLEKSNQIEKFKKKVNLFKFDDFYNEKISKDLKISLIKIDVEDHEYKVIKGMEQFLKDNNPVLIFEHHKKHFYKNQNIIVSNIINLLKNYGYIFFYEYAFQKKNIFNKIFEINNDTNKPYFKLINNFEEKKYFNVVATKNKL